MNAKKQHQINASIEKHFLDDALRDRTNMTREAHTLQAKGLGVRAAFDREEANNAESWVQKRKRLVAREEKLSK